MPGLKKSTEHTSLPRPGGIQGDLLLLLRGKAIQPATESQGFQGIHRTRNSQGVYLIKFAHENLQTGLIT